MRNIGLFLVLLAGSGVWPSQSVAGESPGPAAKLDCKTAHVTVGCDGMVYVIGRTSPQRPVLLRLGRDGSNPVGIEVSGTPVNATANAEGVVAAAFAHFARNVVLWDRDFQLLGKFINFSLGSPEGFSAPSNVEAGPSGDFYAGDQYADRIVRFGPDGVRTGSYTIPREPAGPAGEIRDFRVCERTKSLYVLTRGPEGVLRCFGFDAPGWKIVCKKLWGVESRIYWGEPGLGGGSGAYDVDDRGVLYVADKFAETIRRFAPDGKPLGDLTLKLGPLKPGPQDRGFHTMRICRGEVVLKRMHETELFQRYDPAGGEFRGVVRAGDWKTLEPGAAPAAVPRRAPPPGKTLRVLFVGNSQTHCICDIPEIVEDLSHSLAPGQVRIRADAVVMGGTSLEGLWKDGLVRRKIERGGFDWVVLQEMIDVAENPGSTFRESVRQFDECTRKSGARTLLFATGHVLVRRANYAPMYQANLDMARRLQCRVAGAGMAWLAAWKQKPDLDLHYAGDRAHPNARGYYLNACVLFAALTDLSPIGLDPYGLPQAEAEFLQRTAWAQYAADRAAEHTK